MINKEIIISKKTREIINGENGDLFRLGVDGENLQENIVFKFDDGFVNGTARIEITMQDNTKSYVMINKVNETYVLPVKSILTKTGLNKMQLVITQGTDDEEIPIFKSKMFSFYIAESINADTEQPEEYPQWIDKANTTLNEIDNFDIDAIKELNEATITITDRYGETKSVQVFDGENGQDGKDAKINGVNTLRLLAGKNISLEQEDDELTINAEGGSGGGAVNSVNGMTGDVIIEIPDVSDFITKDVDDLTNYEPKATTGNNIVASIDSSTYVMTLTLRNSNNETLNSQTIDLPLETMVVNGSYDDTTKKIILTLKNGNTIEFSVADLVSGLQSEITLQNKLSASLVDDSSSSNKFLTSNDQNFNGYKTFTNGALYKSYVSIISDYQLVHKKYVDDQLDTKTIQYSTLPTASSSNVGKIVQYIGTTDSTYTNGLFYQCISDGQTYTWKQIPVVPSEQLQYVDTLSKIYNSSRNRLEFENAKRGIYVADNYYNVYHYRINSDSSTTNLSYDIQLLIILNEITEVPSTTTFTFGYLIGSDKTTGQAVVVELYINNAGYIKQRLSSWYTTNDQKYFITNSTQTISGTKTFSSTPKLSSYTAPTNNEDLVAKKYVDDSIASAITSTLGGSY